MNKRRFFTVFGALLGCALALVACRAEEQGRITRYKPGVYLGKKDTPLGEAQREALSQRATPQGDSNYRTVGGGAAKGDVDTGALGARGQKQGGTTP
jgi:hypothetical protein